MNATRKDLYDHSDWHVNSAQDGRAGGSGGGDAFVLRFQQTTPPVMAKGVEDTALYRYFRFVALNEVGGSPPRFSLPVDEFHAANLERARRFPSHLLASQTHDTKRSGDVRARLAALSWIPDEWEAVVRGPEIPAGCTRTTPTSCFRRLSARGR